MFEARCQRNTKKYETVGRFVIGRKGVWGKSTLYKNCVNYNKGYYIFL
jgi:hypothetical protein